MASKRQQAGQSRLATQTMAEAKFMKGETGVDGASVGEEDLDPEVVEQAKAKEALYRGRTWLGREALTWLLWKSESTEALCVVDKVPLKVVFIGKVLLRAGAGDVTELAAKGVSAPYSSIVRQALLRSLLIHGARLRLEHGEQSFEVTLDAERFDFRSAKLPELLGEGDAGEELVERLELVAKLGRLVDALINAFVAVRTTDGWDRVEVPGLLEWFEEGAKKK